METLLWRELCFGIWRNKPTDVSEKYTLSLFERWKHVLLTLRYISEPLRGHIYCCYLRYRRSNLKCTFPGSTVCVILLAMMRSLRTEDICVGKAVHDGIWRKIDDRIKMMFTSQARKVDVVSFRDPAWIPGAFCDQHQKEYFSCEYIDFLSCRTSHLLSV
jgi:hypothetical protein